MRTKTLLIAAAAMAVGVATSMAQVTYSQNIVGYATVVIPGAAANSLIANPFDDGNGNQLTNLLTTLPNKSTITTWNGTSFNAPVTFVGGAWNANPTLTPGAAFFVKNGVAASPSVTNVFVGSVIVNVGATTTNALPAGNNLVASKIPYAGDLTTDTNLALYNSLANKSTITTWNGAGYNAPVTLIGGVWNNPAPVTVGQGYFINSKSSTNWIQTLNP